MAHGSASEGNPHPDPMEEEPMECAESADGTTIDQKVVGMQVGYGF